MIRTILSLCLSVVFATGWTLPVAAAPVLTIDQFEFDFGFAPQNSTISRTFQLRNDGDDTLQITKVVPGCGCTQAPLKKSTLVPGESTELEIIFSTGHYNGPVTKRPRIETNETSPNKNITIYTNVIQRPDSTYPVQVRPYKLDISQFGQTIRNEMNFTIANVSGQDLAVTVVSYPADLLTVVVPSQVSANGSAEAKIVLTKAAAGQSFETSLTLQLNDAAGTRFTIPVKRTIRSPKEEMVNLRSNK